MNFISRQGAARVRQAGVSGRVPGNRGVHDEAKRLEPWKTANPLFGI